MDGFQEGYDFARKSSTVQYAIAAGDQYVQSVDAEIDKLIRIKKLYREGKLVDLYQWYVKKEDWVYV